MTSLFSHHDLPFPKLEAPSLNEILGIPLDIHNKEELTEREKFAICFCSGMEIVTELSKDGNKIIFRTKQKAAVVRIDGQWRVVLEKGLV